MQFSLLQSCVGHIGTAKSREKPAFSNLSLVSLPRSHSPPFGEHSPCELPTAFSPGHKAAGLSLAGSRCDSQSTSAPLTDYWHLLCSAGTN